MTQRVRAGRTAAREILLVATAWIAYVALVRRFWFVCDDAFISFRYARNLAVGHGLRYNLGAAPPVEGFSNLLWVLVAAACESFGADPVTWLPSLSFASGSLLLWLVFDTARGALALPAPADAFAALALGLFPPFAVWSTGGLETLPQALCLFAAFRLLAYGSDTPRARGLAAVAGAALVMLRIEGVAWALLAALAAAIVRRGGTPGSMRSFRGYVFVVLGLSAACAVWRWHTFGELVSNSAVAKAPLAINSLSRGARYAALYVATYVTPAAAFAAALAARPPRRTAALAFGFLLAATLGYAVAVGGDFMTSFRLLVPAAPFQALLLAIGACEVARWRGPAVAAAAGIAALVVALLPAFDLHAAPEPLRASLDVHYRARNPRSEFAQWRFMGRTVRQGRETGLALRALASPDASLVAGAIGAVGYYSGLFIFDRNGLVTPRVALRRSTRAPRSPGHDRTVARTYFLSERPTYLHARTLDLARLMSAEQRAREAQWRRPEFADYAPELSPLPATIAPAGDRQLRVLRRLERGESSATLWRAYEKALARASGERFRGE